MTTQLTSDRRVATRALTLIMGAAIVAWILFIVGQYVALVRSVGSNWEYGQPEEVTFTQFFTVAAIAVFGLGALFAKRRLTKHRVAAQGAGGAPRSSLVEAVSQLASIVLIVASALATLTVFATFMAGFFSGTEERVPLARLVNLYIPIVLYTALVVSLILFGFVFKPSARGAQQAAPLAPTLSSEQPPVANVAAHAAEGAEGTIENASEDAAASGQRSVAFAYATPIIAAAVALLLGLIVYDVTRTALQVWIWVVIVAIVGGGVLVGAILAERSAAHSPHATPGHSQLALPVVPPVVAGATILNFVLSIIFAVVVAGMSLSYGTSALQQLSAAPSLSLTTFGTSESYIDESSSAVTVEEPVVSLWGSDLERGSEAVVTLEPGGETIISARVDGDRWVSAEADWPEGLTPGDYELVAAATSIDGTALEITLRATVLDTDEVRFPDGEMASFDTEQARLIPVSAKWLLGDMLPAALLLLLGIAVVSTTITVRNRDSHARTGG